MQYSIVHKSECVKHDFGNFLFSPEFFLDEKRNAWKKLSEKSTKVTQDYFYSVVNMINEIKQVSICYDLTDGLAKFFDTGKEVSKINSNKKSAMHGDFAISRMRSYLQEMGIVDAHEKPQVFSSEFLIFREKTTDISAHTLFALCMTPIVQTILSRGQYGTQHPRFYDFLLTKLPIPSCLLSIDNIIKKIIEESLLSRRNSKLIYKEAETTLLSELGLTNWQPKHQLSFIKNYSDTKRSGRADAEYYQPKYEEIIKAIKNYSGGWDVLDSLVLIKKCIEVGSDEYLNEGIPFVRVSNISPFEITEEKHLSESLYSELTPQEENISFETSKNHQPNQGEILFSKDGTPGIAHYLNERPQKMIPSGGILRLKNKTDKVNNEYLTLVLNSMLVQEQVNRDVGGSIILHWRPDQVKETVIPILPKEKQKEIQQKVTESCTLRKQSKHLLECAKMAVEIAIEQDEQTAMKWLEKQTESSK